VLELQPEELRRDDRPGRGAPRPQGSRWCRGPVQEAKDLDPRRGEAFYNLGVLYKDFRASKQDDLKPRSAPTTRPRTTSASSRTRRDEADKAEAKEQVTVIDKTTAQIQNFIKAQRTCRRSRRPSRPRLRPRSGRGPGPGAAPAPKK